ncbi:hypothetical protein D3C81_535200 [compost metagenome]
MNRRSHRLEHQHRRTARLAGQGQLPGRRHPVPARPAAHGLADDRKQRYPLGGAGHAAGHGGDFLPARTAQRAADPGGTAAGCRPGLVVGGQGRGHRHAADGRAVQRHGRWLGGGHRRGGTAALCLPGQSRYHPLECAGAGRPGRAPAIRHGPAAGRGRRSDRCGVAVRLGDRLGQTRWPPRQARDLARPAGDEPAGGAGRGGAGHHRREHAQHLGHRRLLRAGARAGRVDDAADRWRRHAGGDLAVQRVHWPGGVVRRLRAGQRSVDHRRHDGRRSGHPADPVDGQGDEPADPQRAVFQFRRWRRGGSAGDFRFAEAH